MVAHRLVFLGDLDIEDSSFIQLLGFAKQNLSEKETIIDDEPCTIHVHEISGLDEAIGQLFCGVEGVVYFYNTASRSSYEHIEAIHDKQQKVKSASTTSAPDAAKLSGTSPPPLQMILVGTVLVGTKREVSLEEGNELARKLGCNFSLETEATVEDALRRIIRLCRQARKAQADEMGLSWWGLGNCLGWRR